MERSDAKWWKIFLGLLVLALLASTWAVFAGSGCGSCSSARALVGGKTLATAGAIFYGALLLAALILGPSLPVFAGIQIAAGIHGALLALLIHREIFCFPCVTAAVACAAALLVSIRIEPHSIVRATFVLPAGAFMIQAWLFFSGGISIAPDLKRVNEASQRVEAGVPALEEGTARLLAYTRPDCGYCIDLEHHIIPRLKAEFGERLTIELRPASEQPTFPTPTILVFGSSARRLFPGLPPEGVLRQTILGAMGESHETATLLPEHR